MCDHQEKNYKHGKTVLHHHQNQDQRKLYQSDENYSQDTHSKADGSIFSEHQSDHGCPCNKMHHCQSHHYHHKPNRHRASLPASALISSAGSFSSSSSSFSSSSSSCSSFSSSSSSSSSSFSSDTCSECWDRSHRKPQHSQSCTNITGKHKYFDGDDDTAPLIDKKGVKRCSVKDKREKGNSPHSPTQGTLNNTLKIRTGSRSDGNVWKSKSMETLSRPKDREEDENYDKNEQERRKIEARKNLIKEKMKFSTFLNEITRQVLSPMTLTTLGVTDAQRPCSPRQASVMSNKMDSSTNERRQQRSRPTSADSFSSSHCSHTSKQLSTQLSKSRSFHHSHTHHSEDSPSHMYHRTKSCTDISYLKRAQTPQPHNCMSLHKGHHHCHQGDHTSHHHCHHHCEDCNCLNNQNHHRDQDSTNHLHHHRCCHFNHQGKHHSLTNRHGNHQKTLKHNRVYHSPSHHLHNGDHRYRSHISPSLHHEQHCHHHGNHHGPSCHHHHGHQSSPYHCEGHTSPPHHHLHGSGYYHHESSHAKTQCLTTSHRCRHHSSSSDHHSEGHHYHRCDSESHQHHHGNHQNPGHHHHHGDLHNEFHHHHKEDHHMETNEHHHGDHCSLGHQHHGHCQSVMNEHHHGDHHKESHPHFHDEHSQSHLHHHGNHQSDSHPHHHNDHPNESNPHHHSNHHNESHPHHHGDHPNESHPHHHGDHPNDSHPHHHGDYSDYDLYCFGNDYNACHHQGHHPETHVNQSHSDSIDFDQVNHYDLHTHGHSPPSHRKSATVSPSNTRSHAEEQTSFLDLSSYKERTEELGRVPTSQDKESLGEAFMSNQLQKTRMELSDLTEKFKSCSSTQQTNDLLHKNLHSVAQNMEGEHERLNRHISALKEQLADAKSANSVETEAHFNVTSALHNNSIHYRSDDAINQVVLPITPPPTQFMDSHDYGPSGQEQSLGSVPEEEEESDWSEMAEEIPPFILTGPNKNQVWRHQEGDVDRDSESGGEERVRLHSARTLQIPHLQFMIHSEILPALKTNNCPSGFTNLSEAMTFESSYRITSSPTLCSSILIRSASLEEIPLTRHDMLKELKGTEAMMDLHHPSHEVIDDLDDEIIHHWRTSNDMETDIESLIECRASEAESSLVSLQSAEQVLNHLICESQLSEGKGQSRAELHGWTGGIPDEVLKGERTKL